MTHMEAITIPTVPPHPPAPFLAPMVEQGTGWMEPQPLVAQQDPEPYPIDALPPSVRAAVVEVQGFVQAPTPLVASSALSALSLAVQGHYDIKRAERLSGPVGLFLLTIAASGERKTSVDRYFTQAIRAYETQQAKAAKTIQMDYQADLDAWACKRSGVSDALRSAAKVGTDTLDFEVQLRTLEADKPEAPRVPRLIYQDATPEALKWNLATVWPSAGVVSSEGGIVLGSNGSLMRTLSTYDQLWDGADIQTDRRGSESFLVHGARLTIALQLQEATLQAFLKQSGELARGMGFLARCLIAWPESTQGSRPFAEAPKAWPSLEAFNLRIGSILDRPARIDANGALAPAMLTFTAAAKAEWVVFHDRVERELGDGGKYREVRDVASKIADNASRIAALFHVFEDAPGGEVGADHFKAAARIAEWHLNESRRFFGELALPAGVADAAQLEAWLISYCRRTGTIKVSNSDALRLGPGRLREKAKIEAAAQELEELGRVQRLSEGKRRFIAVNPSLLQPGLDANAKGANFANRANEPTALPSPFSSRISTFSTREPLEAAGQDSIHEGKLDAGGLISPAWVRTHEGGSVSDLGCQ